MAKIESLFTVHGNLGGTSFFVRNGKMYARNPSTLDGTKFKTDPRYKRIRESNQEFAGASFTGKAFRKSLNSLGQLFKGENLSNRMFIIFRRMVRDGAGARGMRVVDVVAKKDMLAGLSFLPKPP